MALLRRKDILSAGYNYVEYVGSGNPPHDVNSAKKPGDIYVDLGSPHRVLFWNGHLWEEWTSMQTSMQHTHPTLDPARIIMPTAKQFSWVVASGYQGFSSSVSKRLGARQDNVDTHVKIFVKVNSFSMEAIQSTDKPIANDPGSSSTSGHKRKTSDKEEQRRVTMRSDEHEPSKPGECFIYNYLCLIAV
jgi:hypothetical protein